MDKNSFKYLAFVLLTVGLLSSFALAQSRRDVKAARKLNDEGLSATYRGEFVKAIEAYTKALELTPNDPKILVNRGVTYFKTGEIDFSMADLSKALGLSESLKKPDLAVLYYSLGICYQLKRNFERAIEMYNKAIELDPKDKDFYLGRGNSYRGLGREDLAMADYNKSIEISPDAMAYYNRAAINLSKREYAKAIADSDKAIELNPKFPEALNMRGLTHLRMGSTDLAIADFTKAIEIKPHGSYYMNRGTANSQKGDYSVAVADLTKSVEIYPMWRAAYLQRAFAYKRLGQLELSVADTNRAKELEKENFDPFKDEFLLLRFSDTELASPEIEQP